MRKLYWYVTAYIKKHGWVFAASAIGALIIFSLSISVIVQKLEPKPTRYVGLVGRYTLDNLPLPVAQKLSAGLTYVEADDTLSPHIAERWLIEDGGKTYRFVIKKGLKWQDGKELTTNDIHYQLSDVEIITTPNDIIFKLPDEFVPFPVVVSEPVFRQVEQRHLLFFKRPTLIGLGSYKLTDYERDGQRLKSVTIDGAEETLVYRFYFTETDAVMAFKLGQVDELPDLSSPFDIGDWPTTQVDSSLNYKRYLAVFFNNADPLFPKNVRQALSYVTTKPTDESRAYTPINPNSWAYLEGGKAYDQDLERALERLLEELPPTPLNIELTTTNNFVDEAEAIKQEWVEFGQKAYEACQSGDEVEDKDSCVNAQIEVSIRVTNFPDTSNYQVLLVGQEIPPDPDQYKMWHSEQSTNFTHYKNTRIDALLEKGRTTSEKSERKTIYQEFQQFLLEDAPVIFLRYLESYEVKRI